MKMKKRLISALLVLCLCISFVPAVYAAENEIGADFTASDPTAALQTLTGGDSTLAEWDAETKTLTLKGVQYQSNARTAVKLPADSTILLADGTTNSIRGGQMTIAENNTTGDYFVYAYAYGVLCEGALTIRGSGTLSVTGTDLTNTGSADPTSIGLSAQKLTVESGNVTAQGGTAKSTYYDSEKERGISAFSYGVELLNNAAVLTVSGGSLTGLGGVSTYKLSDYEGGSKDSEGFSKGIVVGNNKGILTVSGKGKLTGGVIDGAGKSLLAEGLTIYGKLTVQDEAEVHAFGGTGTSVTGEIVVTSGSFTTTQAGSGWGLELSGSNIYSGKPKGNLTISGGTVNVDGSFYHHGHFEKANYGQVVLSGGELRMLNKQAPSYYNMDVHDLTVSGGKLTAGRRVVAETLTMTGGLIAVDSQDDWYTALYVEKNFDMTGGTVLVATQAEERRAFRCQTLNLDDAIRVSGAVETVVNHADNALTQAFADTPVAFSDAALTELTLTELAAKDKIYDGTNRAELTGGTLNGLETGHAVTLGTEGISASFDDINAGTAKPVYLQGDAFTLHGWDAYRYVLKTLPADFTRLNASILPCTTIADATKLRQTVYEGSANWQTPRFTGVTVNDVTETATGTVSYTVDGQPKTADEITALLKGMKAGETLSVAYTFAGTDNYAGAAVNGTVTISVMAKQEETSDTYQIYVADSKNGTAQADKNRAEAGETVTINAQPDSGYTLAIVSVTDSQGNSVPTTRTGDTAVTFRMPACDVVVQVTFRKTTSTEFVDVPEDAEYAPAVKWAVENGITSGVGNNRFDPLKTCTRGEIVTFLWRMAGSPEPQADHSFTDVPAESYCAKAVAWAVAEGITKGTGNGRFSPDLPCTRAQCVTFLYRAAGCPAVEGEIVFTDVEPGAFYTEAVKWAEQNGITRGVGGGLFGTERPCTRAQIVMLLYRSAGSR